MLYFRKICLLAALALTFGASEIFAQPAGVSIRMVSPADSTWVGIGKSITVDVHSARLRSGLSAPNGKEGAEAIAFIRAFTVSLHVDDDEDGNPEDGDTSLGGIVGVGSLVDDDEDGNNDAVKWETASENFIITGKVHDAQGATHIVRYTFEVKGGSGTDDHSNTEGVYAKVEVEINGETSSTTNLDDSDGKLVKIDNRRPVESVGTFENIGIDIDGSFTTRDSFGVGESINMEARVASLVGAGDAVSVSLGLFALHDDYDASYRTNPDSALALKTFEIGDAAIIGATGEDKLEYSVTVEKDAFRVLDVDGDIVEDNLEVAVAAFLVDRAGNRGATAEDASPGEFSTSSLPTHLLDSNLPTIEVEYPADNPDSNRFTGAIQATLSDYREKDGETTTLDIDLNPLEFSVSEETSALYAIAASGTKRSTADLQSQHTEVGEMNKYEIVDSKVANDTDDNVDAATPGRDGFDGADRTSDTGVEGAGDIDSKGGSKGGKKFNLIIRAEDIVGNRDSVTVNNVWHDQDDPQPDRLFPTSDDLDGDPINEATRHPVLRNREALDSLSVRFIQNIDDGPQVVIQQVGAANLAKVSQSYTVTVQDLLMQGEEYTFQLFSRDLAGNVHLTALDKLTFDNEFENVPADAFVVTTEEDTVLTGYAMRLTITAIDSMLSRVAGEDRVAVTYRKDGVRISAWSGGELASSVRFNGGLTDHEDGTATLNAEDWDIGVRTVEVKSDTVIDNFSILVEDVSTTTVDGAEQTTVNFSGKIEDLAVDESDMRAFEVTAWEDGEEATRVAGEFQVRVVPVDSLGNPSVKFGIDPRVKANDTKLDAGKTKGWGSRTGNTDLFDSRIDSDNKLTSIDIVLSSNHPNAAVPSGPQTVSPEGETFTVIAPNSVGEGLKISIRAADALPSGTDLGGGHAPLANLYHEQLYLASTGSVTVDYGEDVPPAPDKPAAPASLTVEDYPGDQGHVVVVTFPRSASYEVVDQYRLYREVDYGKGPTFVEWETFDATADTLVTQLVTVPDGMPTHWAIEAVSDGTPSGQTVSGKVSAQVVVSDRTQTEAAVAAVDNIAPEAATNVVLDGTTISWTVSPSEGPTGETYTWEGAESEIAGVTGYAIMVGLSPDALHSIGEAAPGVSSFELSSDAIAPLIASGAITQEQVAELVASGFSGVIVRVDALDLSNSTPSETFTLITRRVFVDSEGSPVYIVALNGQTPLMVDFEDFTAFAMAFNSSEGDENFNLQADMNDDGTVNFADFILFFGSFGKEAQGPATKPVILPPGVNENAEFSLRLGSERVVVGENVFVDVSLANVQALMSYGFVLHYDTDKFEFVDAIPAAEDLLKSTGGETPLFSKQTTEESGQVLIANAVVNGSEVSGGGDIVRLVFRVLQEFKENARFEIAEGLVFDPQQLSNQAVVAGVLDIQTTPTEFALLQNFPNPFNPATTIGYELAESADVTLQIYNVVGQVVRTLIVAEPQSAGRYQIRWNGVDDRGVPVSSGIYFYHISAGEFQNVRKLMLLK